ncbi:MAG: DNA alkylation repair protein [Gammaproteobacteria bacterium]
MPDPFKNEYNSEMITQIGDHLKRAWKGFDKNEFVKTAVRNLENLELKERIAHIANALSIYLPSDYNQSVSILHKALAPEQEDWQAGKELGVTGWATLPFNHYVSQHGLAHFDVSMAFFKASTSRFSAEFDIRFFLISDQMRTLALLKKWTKDPNYHVRRLVSESTRPRLPWAMRLQSFIDDPTPIFPLLETLRDDEEEYVRRSVANSLNDISKDHPELVEKIAKAWLKNADQNRKRLVKHACRTLIKQGHKSTLKTLGYNDPAITVEKLNVQTPHVTFGGTLVFDIILRSASDKPQNLIVDYVIHHRKANGSTSPKVFKWKMTVLKPNAVLHARKSHAIRKITTRRYYHGTHSVEILVNGVSLSKQNFELSVINENGDK